ncbi:hypothetical protein ABZ023_01775 [Streptomyces sp. NPDC006367]|uniref:hypothetical protein n=1 Tax=unclassified Streptomyces TaxID=2593676 RepID=UPI0033A9B595
MSENEHRDPFEGRLTAVLRETGDSFDADRAALAAGGQARGRRARLRRRAGVLGGAAGIALVGVGGALVLPGGDDSAGTRHRSAAAMPNATSASPSSAPAFSGDDLVRALKELLPEGEVSQESGRGVGQGVGDGSGPMGAPGAHLVFDDGKGAGAVDVSVGRVEPGSPAAREMTTCPDRTLGAYDACTTSRLADGSVLKLFQGYEYPDRRVDTKWWSAQLVTPRGQHVTAGAWNSSAEKGAALTREQPPLTLAQLQKIATADVWRRVADAIPEDPKAAAGKAGGKKTAPGSAKAGRASEASGAGITEALRRLLPEGVDVVAKSGQDMGYAALVVDDGKGRSLVQVNVQPDMRSVTQELYGDAEKLPDGTLVTTSQKPGEKSGEGVVMRTADTMRADGLRVVVSAFNSEAQDKDATRDVPALSVEQLKEIALSPEWARVR